MSKSKVNGDFLSVLEQSGIKAGDGGFQVTVGGKTGLVGGLLSSSQAAVDAGRNTLTTGSLTASDLQNRDNFSASGYAFSGSVATGGVKESDIPDEKKKNLSEEQIKAAGVDGKPGASAGFGSVSGSQSSTTASGISGGAVSITDAGKQLATGKDVEALLASINRDVTTESAAAGNGLTKGWDAKALQQEVDARVAITQEFSKQAPKAIANYADKQIAEIEKKLLSETDPLKKAELAEERKDWSEGGTYRVALHTVSGALTGGVGGALGSGVVASAANHLEQLQQEATAALVAQGVDPATARMFTQGLAEVTSFAMGTAVGGTTGGGAGLATDTNNRQLHDVERAKITALAKEQASKACRGDADCENKAYIVWADALERVAESLVDAKENAKNAEYLERLASVSANPASEGARSFGQYVSLLEQAKLLLSPVLGDTVIVNGRPSTATDPGGLQKYFSASEKQFNDPWINAPLSGRSDALVWGVEVRDATRLENFSANNGSATPIYPLEEELLGNKVNNLSIKAIKQFFNSLDSVLAGTVGMSVNRPIRSSPVVAESMSPVVSVDAGAGKSVPGSGATITGPGVVGEGKTSTALSGVGGDREVGVTLPGMSRPIRPVNADFPANQGALDFMNSPRLRDMVLDTHCVDCSDIAPQIQRAAGGGGQILEVKPTTRNNLNVYENGSIEPGQSFHQVYTDGRYVYDPRVSLNPIPKGDWMQHMKNINPNGITIKSK